MKSIRYIKNLVLTGASTILLGVSLSSCTNLDEVTFDRIDASNYYQDESSVKAAIVSAYYLAEKSFLEYFFYLNELSADQIAWRSWNGGQWGWDEAEKFVLSSQTWTSESKIIKDAWDNSWTIIGLCTQMIEDLSNLSAAELGMSQEALNSYIAEARTLRAWAYYNNFDLWGGSLPINDRVTSEIPGSASPDFNTGCQLIWDFISSELDAALPDMIFENNAPYTRTRLTQGANRILKMRLLLNSELWTGVDRYNDCAILAQDIIEGKYGTYSLASDYHQIYSEGNETCPEIIFAFKLEWGQLSNNNGNGFYLPYCYNEIFGVELTEGAWNCMCLAPSHDNSGTILNDIGKSYGSTGSKSFVFDYGDKLGAVFDRMNEKDIRRQPFHCDEAGVWDGLFMMGPQYNYETGAAVMADADLDKLPLVYVDQVGTFTNDGRNLEPVMSPRWGMTNSGYRPIKYPIYPAVSGLSFNNISEVEFRLAEVYYTLAECKMRSGDTGGAKNLVNEVRKRYYLPENRSETEKPGPGFTSFDMDWMLSEWGLEFLGEARRRRTDLRRFDKFTQGQWWFFGRANETDGRILPEKRDRKYEWYPLPQTAMMVNPGLVQNPNY